MQPIRVYSDDLRLLTETDNYISLQFTPRFYEAGEFEIHINQYMEGAEYFQIGNYIVLDKQGDKAMVIRHREVSLDSNGKASENWKITGVTLDGILDQRVTIPPEYTSHDRKKGNAETVMKHYVERHLVNPDDPERKIDFLEIAPNKNRGSHVDWESRFRNVGDEITSISKLANIGWTIYADMERRKWIFDVVEPRDVTQDNPTGLQPVFFSPDYQTIKNQQFVDSNINYRNVGYVGGQGEGTERKIVKIGEAKGIHLHEVFIDARDVGDTLETEDGEEIELTPEEEEALLIERGEQKMREFETTFYLEAQILTPSIRDVTNDFAMSTPFEYEVDFRLGDIVQVFNKTWNITMDAPITEIKEIHEAGGFILEAVFGEARPTLIQKITNKFNEILGIENQELPAKLSVEQMRKAVGISEERISEEEKKRIEQALKNLEESKEYANEQAYQAEKQAKEDSARYTEEYAEKKRVESDIPPNDKGVIWIDISNPDNVVWKVWKDDKWIEGPGGPKGEDGLTAYTHIAYADDKQGNGFSKLPEDKAYIGMYTDHTPSQSEIPSDYRWTLIKGADGEKGVPGPKGEDGNTPYFHTAWANSFDGVIDFSTTDSLDKAYIGTYTDYIAEDSTEPSDYKWSKIKGEPGSPGEDGKSLYTWVKYADSPTSGMSDTPDGKKYIGLAYNKETPTESNSYSDYDWAKIEGDQGVPGVPGADGTPRYTWVKYADDENGNGISDSAEGKRYLGLAHNKTSASESSNPSDYSWSPLYDNVKVGGRNIASISRVTTNQVTLNDYVYRLTRSNGSSNPYLRISRDYFHVNSDYVATFKVKKISGTVFSIAGHFTSFNGGTTYRDRVMVSSGSWNMGDQNYPDDNEIHEYEVYFKTPETFPADSSPYWYIQPNRSAYGQDYVLEIWDLQIEKGNVPSNYDRAPEDVDKDIKDAEDNAKSHANEVSEAAYIDAVNDAEEYMEANGIMQGAKYNGVSITNLDGFVTARGDGLVRTVMNSTLGYVVQKRSSTSSPWENVIYIDTNGDINFTGNLDGATGTFSGALNAETVVIGQEDPSFYGFDSQQILQIKNPVRITDGTYVWGTPFEVSAGMYEAYVRFGGKLELDVNSLTTRDGEVDSIVLQGSNANGHFIRYANGIQICWGQPFAQATNSRYSDTSITTSATDYWTYPAEFNDDYPISVSATCSALSRVCGTTGYTGNGSAPIRTYSLSGAFSNTAYSVYAMAIGRWK